MGVQLTVRTVPYFAQKLLDKFGLVGWRFEYDRARRRAGCCKYGRKLITLSYFFVRDNNDAQIKDTILHEIAHAIAGHEAAHGPKWQAVCVEIGANPTRCYDHTTVIMPPAPYHAQCPNCRQEFKRHKLRRGGKYHCTRCGPTLGAITFRRL